MKTKLLAILILFNLNSLFAQFNDNDYTNMFEAGGSITEQDGFSVDFSYSYIYYMGIWGNLALRPEMVAYSDGAFQGIAKLGAAIWYGYDFGNETFHVLPYGGIAFNFPLFVDTESGIGFVTNAIFGTKVFFPGFGIFGEYKYNLTKNFPENYNSRLSLGLTFASGHSYIPQPPAPKLPKPVPQKEEFHYPQLTEEEFNALNIEYSATIEDIAGDNRAIYIDNSNRNNFIKDFDSPVNNQNRNNAVNATLEFYTDKSLSGVLAQVAKTNNEYMKARYIHDWITDNIEYEAARLHRIEEYNNMLNSGSYSSVQLKNFSDRYIPDFTVKDVIDRRNGVCMDYALLFHYVAIASGLDAYYINDQTLCHAYNLVVIDDICYIIDTTWDAGMLNQYDRFVYRFSKKWFLHRVKDNWSDRK